MTKTAALAQTLTLATEFAVTRADNDNAGAAWFAADVRRDEVDDSHLSTYVHATAAVFHAAAGGVDADFWRFARTTLDGRQHVYLVPRQEKSRATVRRERVLRAYLRAVGVDCC